MYSIYSVHASIRIEQSIKQSINARVYVFKTSILKSILQSMKGSIYSVHASIRVEEYKQSIKQSIKESRKSPCSASTLARISGSSSSMAAFRLLSAVELPSEIRSSTIKQFGLIQEHLEPPHRGIAIDRGIAIARGLQRLGHSNNRFDHRTQ